MCIGVYIHVCIHVYFTYVCNSAYALTSHASQTKYMMHALHSMFTLWTLYNYLFCDA